MAEAELETLRNERTIESRQRETWEEKMKAQEEAVTDHDTELEH